METWELLVRGKREDSKGEDRVSQDQYKKTLILPTSTSDLQKKSTWCRLLTSNLFLRSSFLKDLAMSPKGGRGMQAEEEDQVGPDHTCSAAPPCLVGTLHAHTSAALLGAFLCASSRLSAWCILMLTWPSLTIPLE